MAIRLIMLDPAAADLLRAVGLLQYHDFVSDTVGRMVHETGTTRTRRITLPTDGSQADLYLKVHRYAGGHRRSAWRRDKAAIEARNYAYLGARCRVDVPDVIAHGRRTRAGWLVDSFILTRAVPGAEPLDRFAAKTWPDPRAKGLVDLRRSLLEQSARMISRMHAAGFYHVDLQWRNLLVARVPGAAPRFYVIDSTRGGPRRLAVFRRHGQLRDLSSLAKEAARRLSRCEQVRWLRSYLGTPRLGDAGRRMIEAIVRDRHSKDHGAAE